MGNEKESSQLGAGCWKKKDLGSSGRCWLCPRPARLHVVFVHGFQGDHQETWTYRPPREWRRLFRRPAHKGILLFDLLGEDASLDCNYYSIAHEARILSPTNLRSAAGILRTFLSNYVPPAEPVALVAHSFGGLACRLAILDLIRERKGDSPVVALLMLGTPNRGTEIARAAKTLGSAAGRNMRPFDDDLAELNREWAASVVNGGDPDRDPDRRTALLCRAVVGSQDFVVPAASATALSSFASIETLNKGHIDLAKAAHRDDSTYVAVSRFLGDAIEASKSRQADAAVRRLTHRLRRASLANRWVRREEEHTELERTEHPHRLRSKIRNVREGALASKSFVFSISATGYRSTDRAIDFDWELGRGTLGDAEYSRLTESAQAELESFFTVSRIHIRQEGREGPYILHRKEQLLGQSLLEYRAPEWIREDEPFECFEIAVESFVDLRQGWYFYYLPRTVTDRLEVSFKAPFRYGAIPRLGRGARTTGPDAVASSFLFRAVVEAPVAIGRSVTWIYRGNEG